MSAEFLAFNIGSSWSLTFRVKKKLRAFENRVSRKTVGTKMDEVTGSGENYIMRNFLIGIP